MTRAEVLRLAKAKWGKKAFVEERKDAPDKETRAIILKEHEAHLKRKPVPPPKTPEQLKYEAEYRKWNEERQRLEGYRYFQRYAVGDNSSWITHIYGSGDTWEEAARAAKLIPQEADNGTGV